MTDAAFDAYMKEAFGISGSKRAGLARASETKRKNLNNTPLKQEESYGLGHSIIDGNIVSNKNKLYNDNTGSQLAQGLSNLNDSAVYGEAGNLYQRDPSTGEPISYEGTIDDTSHFYMGKGKTDPNILKTGVSKYGVEPRYNKGQAYREGLTSNSDYGYPSGPEGIDANNAYLNLRAPKTEVEQYEALLNGAKGVINSKIMYDDGSQESIEKRKSLGGGASEYTFADQHPLLNNLDENVKKGLQPYIPNTKKLTRSDRKMAEMEASLGNLSDSDGMWGESADIAQAGVVKLGANVANMMDKGIKNVFGEEAFKSFDNIAKTMDEVFGLDRNYQEKLREEGFADKEFGVKPETRKEQNKLQGQAQKAWTNGNYFDVAVNITKGIPYMLGDSVAETAMIMIPGIGLTTMIATRVSEQAEEYEKNNDKKPDMNWFVQSTLTNSATLMLEKFIIKLGFKKIGGMITKGNKAGDKLLGFAGAHAMEGIQEWSDQLQEMYNIQKEGDRSLKQIAKSPEAIVAGLSGSVMAGSLYAGGAAIDVPRAGIKGIAAKKKNNKIVEEKRSIAEDLDTADFGMQQASTEGKAAQEQLDIDGIERGKADIEKAESMEDLEQSSSKEAVRLAKNYRLDAETQVFNSERTAKDFVNGFHFDTQEEQNAILKTLNLDEGASDAHIQEAFMNAPVKEKNSLLEATHTDLDQKSVSKVMNENFIDTKKAMTEELNVRETEKEVLKKDHEARLDKNQKRRDKAIKSGKAIDVRKDEEIDVSEKDLNQNVSIPARILSVLIGRKTANEITKNKLKGFSTESIERAKNQPNATPSFITQANKILKSRNKAEVLGGKLNTEPVQTKKQITKADTAKAKFETFDNLKKIAMQKTIDTKEELNYALKMVNKAVELGHISKTQADYFTKRIQKVGSHASKATAEQLKELAIPKNMLRTEAEVQAEFKASEKKAKESLKNLDKMNKKYPDPETPLTSEDKTKTEEDLKNVMEHGELQEELLLFTSNEENINSEYNNDNDTSEYDLNKEQEQKSADESQPC